MAPVLIRFQKLRKYLGTQKVEEKWKRKKFVWGKKPLPLEKHPCEKLLGSLVYKKNPRQHSELSKLCFYASSLFSSVLFSSEMICFLY